jgi:DNA-binding transcriptional regulator YdaS (Cro superfamily)
MNLWFTETKPQVYKFGMDDISPPEANTGILAAIVACGGDAGGQAELARRMSITPQAITKFLKTGCPPLRVLQMEAVTGVSRHTLRPDLYPIAAAMRPDSTVL